MDDIEKRLHNAEIMLLALITAIKDVLPPAYQDLVVQRRDDWYEASLELGAFDLPSLKKRQLH